MSLLATVWSILSALAIVVAVALPAQAASIVERIPLSGTETSVVTSDLGCLPYRVTLTERRTVRGTLLVHADGEVHVQLSVVASFTLRPRRAGAGPSYSGTYREHVAGRFIQTQHGDEPIVLAYVARSGAPAPTAPGCAPCCAVASPLTPTAPFG